MIEAKVNVRLAFFLHSFNEHNPSILIKEIYIFFFLFPPLTHIPLQNTMYEVFFLPSLLACNRIENLESQIDRQNEKEKEKKIIRNESHKIDIKSFRCSIPDPNKYLRMSWRKRSQCIAGLCNATGYLIHDLAAKPTHFFVFLLFLWIVLHATQCTHHAPYTLVDS